MQEQAIANVNALLRSWSSYTSLATCDRGGHVDIAPVGSTFFPSPDTIACFRGPLAKTRSNLGENPEAVFLVSNVSRTRLLKLFLTGTFGAPYGYRIHARFRDEQPLDEAEKLRLFRSRLGWLVHGRGARRIAGLLHQVLLFDVLEVREVVIPYRGAR